MQDEAVTTCAIEQRIEEIPISSDLTIRNVTNRKWITEMFHDDNPLVESSTPESPFRRTRLPDEVSARAV